MGTNRIGMGQTLRKRRPGGNDRQAWREGLFVSAKFPTDASSRRTRTTSSARRRCRSRSAPWGSRSRGGAPTCQSVRSGSRNPLVSPACISSPSSLPSSHAGCRRRRAWVQVTLNAAVVPTERRSDLEVCVIGARAVAGHEAHRNVLAPFARERSRISLSFHDHAPDPNGHHALVGEVPGVLSNGETGRELRRRRCANHCECQHQTRTSSPLVIRLSTITANPRSSSLHSTS